MANKLPALAGNDFVSTVTGGTLREMNRDGDHVTDIPVPPGRHRVSRFMVGIGRAHTLLPGADVICFPADQRHNPSDFGEMQYETAAAQKFQVDRQEREKRRNDRLERMLNAQERRLALQERALERSRGPDPDQVAAEQKQLAEQAEKEAAKIAADKKAADEKPAA